MKITPGKIEDAAAINDIYNWYVANSTVTFDVEPWPIGRREQWMERMLNRTNSYNLVTARAAGELVGLAYNGPFRPKAAYASSTEVTIYTHPTGAPQGVGSLLYHSLFERIAETSLHRAYALISLPNERSIGLHRKFGFEDIGTLSEVGLKFDRHIDVAWYQKKLGVTASVP